MRLRVKIALFISTTVLVLILLFNIFTYFTVTRLATKSQISLLWNAAKPLMSQRALYEPELSGQTAWMETFLLPQSMIRVIGTDSAVKAELNNEESLQFLPTAFSPLSFSRTLRTGGVLIIYIQTPVIDDAGHTLGALQIARKLDTLGEYLKILVKVMIFTMGGAVVFSLISGLYYARRILRPIHRLAFVMESNQRNGVFKQMELAPNTKHDELDQLIHTFNTMIETMEQNFNRQKQFLADASHELKTPLTIIESYADLLKRWGGSDPELRTEAIDAIQSEAERLRNLTHSLLTMANTENEARRQWSSFDLPELIRTTGAKLQKAFHREIRFEVIEKAAFMNGNPEQIKQLLIILLDNAIKYSQSAVQVILYPDPRDKEIVVMQVADRGIGIEATEIPRLFDRFYRVDQARSRSTGGSGLGLSIARSIVQLHKGTISIASTPGVGTQVTVRLPLNAAQPYR